MMKTSTPTSTRFQVQRRGPRSFGGWRIVRSGGRGGAATPPASAGPAPGATPAPAPGSRPAGVRGGAVVPASGGWKRPPSRCRSRFRNPGRDRYTRYSGFSAIWGGLRARALESFRPRGSA